MASTGEQLIETKLVDINLKDVCVYEKHNKYPKTIPKERGTLVTIVCIVLICLSFLIDICTNENKVTAVLALYSISLLIYVDLHLLHRTILVFEELKHLTSRYEGSFKILIKDAYSFPTLVWIAVVVAIIYDVFYFCNFVAEFKFNKQIFLLIPSIYLLGVILELDSSSLYDSLWITKNNGLDYGSGMAYSFFYGYLDLVLPVTGTEEKGLRELMMDYEDKNHIKFAAYKLFILIPKSLTCFHSLKNDNSPSIDESISLPEKLLTIAGVQKRVYKNAVYKISLDKNPQKKIYVSAEYATPLRTFKLVFNSRGDHAEYYEKHKNDIILQFYLTLKKILETTGLSEFCEPIYYEDCCKNEDNEPIFYDVGKIILTRLKQLKKQQKKREKTE